MTKVLILAGGKGTRFSEKTIKQPKPLINIARQAVDLVHNETLQQF